jgi:hypothetical protein
LKQEEKEARKFHSSKEQFMPVILATQNAEIRRIMV